MGTLGAATIRGSEIFSFEYDPAFLKSDAVFEMDPDLRLFSGSQYPGDNQRNFGIFLDSSPDRWGRILMDRYEAVKSKMEKRPRRRLVESDYLLGVHDESRMGALRFKTDPDSPFLNNDPGQAVPPMTSLRALEQAVHAIENRADLDDQKLSEQLRLLLAPGSSLGGARPKASVTSGTGQLWIAKFPSRNDTIDSGAWEYLLYQLAGKCQINMAKSSADRFFSDQTTFLTRRFDRDDTQRRIHFFSAMTLLGYQDGAGFRSGVSYLELAELIISRGSNTNGDLEQLWRRIVFNILVANTDDHLRNHGFLLKDAGLFLSPAYDLNPNPGGAGLHLNIDEQDNRLDTEIARSVAEYFRLSPSRSTGIISEMKKVVSTWVSVARKNRISNHEIELMAAAFDTER
ncbi:MAG: type II toxin-antitoxin system HipA family toxin [Balneolaceae bacterium]|nr:MAG: type II toxin-antitoxin system HipA family toxin [Balneolaceae bacterium]